jgi:GLPGLI family protein
MNKKSIRQTGVAALICLSLQAGNLMAQVRINIVQGDETLKTEPIDDVLFAVQYQMTSVLDTLHPEKTESEMMMLKVGAKTSVYYSYAKFLADSAIAADKAAGLGMDLIVEHAKNYQSRIDYKIYKNYPAGKTTTLDQLGMNRFRCEEVNEIPEWELLPDTMTFLSYPCLKAACRFKGRDYEAWFTVDIPRGEGPWKLQGLPGLILKASDSRKEYVFECTGLSQIREKETIEYGDSGHESVSRKELNKVFERYAADPIGYMTSSAPNVRVVMKDPEGNSVRPKNTPYNPVERREE